MTNRLLSFVPAAVIGGTILLTACGQGGLPSGNQSTAPGTGTRENPVQSEANPNVGSPMKSMTGGGRPQGSGDNAGEGNVNCGPVQVSSDSAAEYSLIADKTADGIVGCTEAFNVLAEYLEAPIDPAGGSQRNKKLSNGWSCSTDGGSGSSAEGNIYCTNGDKDEYGATTGGLALHTEAA